MNIYILRHGETDFNLKGKFQGQVDIPLNQIGINQIEETAKKLSSMTFDIVFSSPLKRALQTAEIVTDTTVLVDKRLIERSFGLLEGKNSINDYEEKIEQYHIERIIDLEKRVFSFMDELIDNYKNYSNILIVTHACVARMIESYLYHKSYEQVDKEYKLGNGDYKKYEVK